MKKKIYVLKNGRNSRLYEDFQEFLSQLKIYPGVARSSFSYDTELDGAGEEVEGSYANARRRAESYLNGERGADSPFEESSVSLRNLQEKCGKLQEQLKEKVIGQEQVIDRFARMLFHCEKERLSHAQRQGVAGAFLFAGPPGVGKTLMAEEAASLLKLPHKRFDMAAYSRGDAVIELIGISKTFKDSRPGILTDYVKQRNKAADSRCVLIFDEIEKACIQVIRLFLQVFSAGTLHDAYYDEEIAFQDVVMIFTTNAGRALYEDTGNRNLSGLSDKEILTAIGADRNPITLEPYFPPEILSRFASANVIMFNPMRAADIRSLIRKDIDRRIENDRKRFKLEISAGKEVLADTVQYSAGGVPDARIASRVSGKQIDREIMEVYSMEGGEHITQIQWSCDLQNARPEVQKLYQGEQEGIILFYGEKPEIELPEELREKHMTIRHAADEKELKTLLYQEPVLFAVVDVPVRELPQLKSVPWYVLDMPGAKAYTETDRRRFILKGCLGFLDHESPQSELLRAYREVSCDRAMEKLYLRHQVLAYDIVYEFDTAESARVTFTNMRLETAPDAGDTYKLMKQENNPGVHWSDLCISDDIRDELKVLVESLKNPRKFAGKGAGLPRGILLYGPPGTGKTSLAKVVATESGLPFMSVSADQMRSEGAEGIHQIFRTARKYAPVILFVDEIDAIGKDREKELITTPAFNALLTEMDGFDTDDDRPVFVMAATNLADSLDAALMRRFDRTMRVDLPDEEGYRWLLGRLLDKNKASGTIAGDKLDNLAKRAAGMRVSPAELEKVFAMALRKSILRGVALDDEMLDMAFEKHLWGENTQDKQEDGKKRELRTACHEAGHALVQLHFGGHPSYMSVVARGDHGGYVMSDPSGELEKEKLLEMVCGLLAGRGAEQVYDYGLTPGASSDLEKATRIVKAMVCSYGMYEDEIGLAVIGEKESIYRSDVRDLVNRILSEQMTRAKKIISGEREAMDRLIAAVTESKRKYLTKTEIEKAYRPENSCEL